MLSTLESLMRQWAKLQRIDLPRAINEEDIKGALSSSLNLEGQPDCEKTLFFDARQEIMKDMLSAFSIPTRNSLGEFAITPAYFDILAETISKHTLTVYPQDANELTTAAQAFIKKEPSEHLCEWDNPADNEALVALTKRINGYVNTADHDALIDKYEFTWKVMLDILKISRWKSVNCRLARLVMLKLQQQLHLPYLTEMDAEKYPMIVQEMFATWEEETPTTYLKMMKRQSEGIIRGKMERFLVDYLKRAHGASNFDEAELLIRKPEGEEEIKPKKDIDTIMEEGSKLASKIYSLLKANPYWGAASMAYMLKETPEEVERQIKMLYDAGRIKRVGNESNGYWVVNEE